MSRPWKLSAVQILTLMVFWGQIQNYMMRTNLSILIVEMVSNNVTSNIIQEIKNQTHDFETCKLKNADGLDTSDKPEVTTNRYEKLDWSPFMQGQVLASFSYGYVLTQIIGGRLAEKYGIRKIYGGSLFLTGIITFLLPVAAKLHVNALIFLRVYFDFPIPTSLFLGGGGHGSP